MGLNEILNAIVSRLSEIYPECAIYTNSSKQEMKEPRFFVNLLEQSRKPMLGRRSFQQNQFCIQYFPAAEEGKTILYDVLSTLLDRMEYITLEDGSLLRGSNRSGREEDGILNFFVSYNLFVISEVEATETMEEIEVKGGVIDG